jgi:hypothetical protein
MKRQERTTSKQRRRPKSKRHKISARTTKTYRPPRTSEEFFALPKKFQDQWNRVVQVPSEMRAQGLSLPQATRPLGVSPKTVIRLAGSAFTKRRGRYQVKPTDRLLRVLVIPSRKGLREIPTRDSREASLIGEYWSAVEKFLTRGDSSALRKLRRKYVTDAHGKRVRFLMDLEELKRQASAGVLHFESLYGRRA